VKNNAISDMRRILVVFISLYKIADEITGHDAGMIS
jgi:hypothetical protein